MSAIDLKRHAALDYFLLLLLCFCLIVSLLPFHLIYKENISLIFALITVSLFIFYAGRSWQSENIDRSFLISRLLFAYLIYILIQIIPLPTELMSRISVPRSLIWQAGAYGLKDYATLSLDISATVWSVILLACYFSIFLLTTNLVITQRRLLIVVFVIFSLGIYQIAFDLISKSLGYQYISSSETDGHSYRLTGTFINSNNLSALINISFASGLALLMILFDRFKSGKKIISLGLIILVIAGQIILLYGSIQSGSAGGLLSLFLAVAVILTLLLCRRLELKGLMLIFGFFVCTISLLVFYGSRELNIEQLTQRLTLSGRPDLWMAVINMWKDFPVFGVGAGAFEWTFPGYKTDELSPLRIVNAHSTYLNLLVETGLVGICFMIMIVYIYIKNIMMLVKANPNLVYLVGCLMTGWVAFMTHEAVENNFLLPSVAMPFFCLMALVLCVGKIDFNLGKAN